MSPILPVAIGLDVGTSGARAMAVDLRGRLVASGRAAIPASAMRTRGPCAEQDPGAWTTAAQQALRGLTAALGSKQEVVGISVDATSGTFLLVDGSLCPLTPGLMYSDLRATDQAALCGGSA